MAINQSGPPHLTLQAMTRSMEMGEERQQKVNMGTRDRSLDMDSNMQHGARQHHHRQRGSASSRGRDDPGQDNVEGEWWQNQ